MRADCVSVEATGSGGSVAGAALVLFLLPTLGMVGYIVANPNVPWNQFFQELSRSDAVGLAGPVAVAFVGIGLSRFSEAP